MNNLGMSVNKTPVSYTHLHAFSSFRATFLQVNSIALLLRRVGQSCQSFSCDPLPFLLGRQRSSTYSTRMSSLASSLHFYILLATFGRPFAEGGLSLG